MAEAENDRKATRLVGMADLMRRSWDARSDFHYVDTRQRTWDTDAFYAGGRAEASMLLPPAFERLGFDPAGKRMLEIGCGPGRLFPGHADFFSEVWGIDVSPEMIRLGEELCPVDARFILGSGYDLREIEDDSIDYCFSYLVFHHLPYEDVVWAYFEEILRVLRPGMCFQVQFLGRRSLQARAARVLGSRVPGDARTWIGATIPALRAEREVSGLGFRGVLSYPISASAYWLVGTRPTSGESDSGAVDDHVAPRASGIADAQQGADAVGWNQPTG